MFISNLGYALLGVGFILHFSLLCIITAKKKPSSVLFLSGMAFYLLGLTIVVVGNLVS